MIRRRAYAVLLGVFSIALFVVAACPAFAAGTMTHMGNFSGTVGSVHALDFNTVVVGGSYTPPDAGSSVFPVGRIYRSENAGTSFLAASMTTSFMVTDVEFADDAHGWATGSGFDAQSYRTTDGGKSWAPMGAFARKATKKALSFSSALNGWAVGQQGIVERTTDGGSTWTLLVEPVTGPDANAVDFVDADNGWMAGGIVGSGGGFIKRTTNGGQTWTTQKSGLSNWLNDIAFIDTLHGVAVGSGGTLLVTEDGGTTWKQAKVPRTSALGGSFLGDIYGVAWAGRGLVLAAGASGLLVASTDLGKTWTDESDPLIRADFTSIGAAGGSRAWLTAKNALYRYTYTPPPTTWAARTSGTEQYLMAVDFVDSSYGWVVGYGGTILKTTNGGKTWKQVGTGVPVARFTGVDFVDRNNGWVVGGYEVATPLKPTVILRTTDGGKTWTSQTHPNDGTYVWHIKMTSKTSGWIMAEPWRIGQTPLPTPYFSMLQTTDGGDTWVAHKDSPPDLMREVVFPSATVGYAVGYRGWDFKTTDGGANWTRMGNLGAIGRAMGVAFTSISSGVIAGDRVADAASPGIIAQTADGGATWSFPPLPTSQQLRRAASRGSSVWVVGNKGTILRSGNSGASWGSQKSGTDKDLWGVQAVGPDQIVAVGAGGTILVGGRPSATVSKPKLGFAAKPKQFLQITGTVKPAVAGSKTKVVVYRKVSGKWKTHATIRAENFINVTSKGERYSRYYANGKAGAAGEYSAIATFEHPDYKTSKSARFTFRVK